MLVFNQSKTKNMKRKFLYILLLTAASVFLSSCKKSFLDVSPKGQFLESNYYQTADQALTGLVAAYDPLGMEAGSTDNTYIDPLGGLNSASDECYAGGVVQPIWTSGRSGIRTR